MYTFNPSIQLHICLWMHFTKSIWAIRNDIGRSNEPSDFQKQILSLFVDTKTPKKTHPLLSIDDSWEAWQAESCVC